MGAHLENRNPLRKKNLQGRFIGSSGGTPFWPDPWRFRIDVAKVSERTVVEPATPRTREVILRSAVMMAPARGGIFDTLLSLVV